MFRDSASEKALRDGINQVAELAGIVVAGRAMESDLDEVWNERHADLQAKCDAVKTAHGQRAVKKLLEGSHQIAFIHAGGHQNAAAGREARDLMRAKTETLV